MDTNTYIALRDLPDQLPPRGGRRIHIASCHRWATTGVAGEKLRTISIGGTRVTTLAWVEAWAERVARARAGHEPVRPSVRTRRGHGAS